MNIYIPDIKLPKDEPGAFQVIVMYVGADKKLRAECGGTHEVTIVPPHGRLIDQDEILREVIRGDYPDQWIDKNELLRLFRNALTIIPAEEAHAHA